MTFFRETTEQYAHRQNLARYRRLLDTHLTAEERRFVERRVAEEQAALQRLSASAASKTLKRRIIVDERPLPHSRTSPLSKARSIWLGAFG